MKYILSNRMKKMFSLLTALLLIFSISLSSISNISYADTCVFTADRFKFIIRPDNEIVVEDITTKKRYKIDELIESTPSSVTGSNKSGSNTSKSTPSSVIILSEVEDSISSKTKKNDSPVRKNFISRCRECVSGCYSCVPLVSCMASCKYCKCCSSIREKISLCFRACTSRCLGLKKKSETVKTGSETKDSDKSDINTVADTVLAPSEQ